MNVKKQMADSKLPATSTIIARVPVGVQNCTLRERDPTGKITVRPKRNISQIFENISMISTSTGSWMTNIFSGIKLVAYSLCFISALLLHS